MDLVRPILRLALPSIATFSSMTFTGLLVLMIVGKLGAAAIAVVGISNILMYNVWAMFSGVQGTINYLVAQNFGSNTMKQGNQRMQIALLGTLLQAVVLFGASFALPYWILKVMGSNEEILTLGAPYVQVRIYAMIFTLFSGVFFAYMRAIGDTKTPMTISLINSGLVVALTYLLAYGKFGFPDLGLQGAAWGMVAAEVITLLLNLIVFYRLMHKKYNTRAWIKMELAQVKMIFSESVKLGVTEMSNSVGMLVFTACITRLGTTAIAANEIALNILSFGFMPSNGFGAASTIGIGQEVGKGRPLEARRFGLVTVYLGLLFMVLVSLFLFLFALPVAKLYTSEAAVYMTAISLIHLASFIQLFTGGSIIFAGGLRGIGDTTFLSRTSLVLNWALFIPCTVLLTQVYDFGQVGAWTALCMLIVLQAIANGWRYLSLDWRSASAKSAPAASGAAMHM
ncbi:MATE efflux family protein [Paenibacillus mucilaginosus 3016]|uniref:Probable multidrug resistance protein NorM n=2 Tax=Paenibacillus mucilaginosus TaxID=61624 RepID=H6NCY6_9BACL|nr:MATE family efflux transporter [Paenibacillus mucilaginosus]AFC29468.1 MATE efflux family protein [Paenibacillus mucilaginosus 3016]AFH61645.1 multidrug transporter MatE [Paenibacillus mucilaginosus K02]WFA18176.1 MATE family efflux transporter [Paenibacillus mucilaginosus]